MINAGADKSDATSAFGLKKVTADMKAKNLKDKPVLQPKQHKEAPQKKETVAVKEKAVGPPRLELDKGTWFCENYDGKEQKELIIPDVQMKQSVYIMRCRNMTIRIPDKCKAISLDKCERLRVEFKSVVSTCEVVNSGRCWVSCSDACPAFALDKSNGISVIITKAVRDQPPAPPEIVTSCISECNFVIPGANDDADPIEMPIPEQFSTKYNKATKKIDTAPVTHGG